jgi:alpha-amylase
LAYAVILTFPGYPCVYYRDYATDPGCYGLKPHIDNLIWIHEHLAGGAFVPRLDTDPQVFVHERLGYGVQPGCLCGFNNDPNNERTVTVLQQHPPNTRLHEYTGKYNTDLWVKPNGTVTFTLPKNINGMAYLVFAPWITPPPGFGRSPIPTTQTFFGDADLDIPALVNGANTVGRIYCAKGSNIDISLASPITLTDAGKSVIVNVLSPDGVVVPYSDSVASVVNLSVDGFYTLIIHTVMEAGASQPFELIVTYLSPAVPVFP